MRLDEVMAEADELARWDEEDRKRVDTSNLSGLAMFMAKEQLGNLDEVSQLLSHDEAMEAMTLGKRAVAGEMLSVLKDGQTIADYMLEKRYARCSKGLTEATLNEDEMEEAFEILFQASGRLDPR